MGVELYDAEFGKEQRLTLQYKNKLIAEYDLMIQSCRRFKQVALETGTSGLLNTFQMECDALQSNLSMADESSKIDVFFRVERDILFVFDAMFTKLERLLKEKNQIVADLRVAGLSEEEIQNTQDVINKVAEEDKAKKWISEHLQSLHSTTTDTAILVGALVPEQGRIE